MPPPRTATTSVMLADRWADSAAIYVARCIYKVQTRSWSKKPHGGGNDGEVDGGDGDNDCDDDGGDDDGDEDGRYRRDGSAYDAADDGGSDDDGRC